MLYFPRTESNGMLIDSYNFQFPLLSTSAVLVTSVFFSGFIISIVIEVFGLAVPSSSMFSPVYTIFGILLSMSLILEILV